MTLKQVYTVPAPEGAVQFEDWDLALRAAERWGIPRARILTEFFDEAGNLVEPPPELNGGAPIKTMDWAPIYGPKGEADPIDIFALKAQGVKLAQDAIAEALILSKASAPTEFTQPPQVTPQDLGAPSPVPYSLFLRRPSADIDATGQETRQSTISTKTLQGVINEVMAINPIPGLDEFIEGAFEAGVYRLEIIVGDISIKVYKHPNN